MSNGIVRTGVGGAAADSITQIGANITLPAGGPHIIHGVYAMAVQDTGVTSESVGGGIRVEALSGDLTPDPAPGRYPVLGMASQSSANFGIHSTPLNIWPVNWSASGKATLAISYINDSGNATAPIVLAGLLFGESIPVKRPLVFCDRVSVNLTAATEATIGSITLAEKATRIVGVMATALKDGAVTADEGMLAHIRLDSADIKVAPAQFPCSHGYSAADGTPAGGGSLGQAQFIPVDIPVIGGSIITCFGTLVNAVTAGLDVQVYLAYE